MDSAPTGEAVIAGAEFKVKLASAIKMAVNRALI
jgi:hypothetical protein